MVGCATKSAQISSWRSHFGGAKGDRSEPTTLWATARRCLDPFHDPRLQRALRGFRVRPHHSHRPLVHCSSDRAGFQNTRFPLTEISHRLTNTRGYAGRRAGLQFSAGKKDRFRGSSGSSVSGNPKTVSTERGKERSETRFACDRDRFAVKSRSRRGSGRRARDRSARLADVGRDGGPNAAAATSPVLN